DLGIRGNYYDNQFGMQRDYANNLFGAARDRQSSRMNLYSQIISNGMQVPEFMADPEAFFGFSQFAAGDIWNSIFGWGY
ncbi:hypothetical protein, partial [Streptococcus pneumoniae]|uniref:hypothetical protein n=1 Tax=Streptococcus pneumoniae TaxID=1313 RepID=UPI0018B0DD01